MLKWSTIVNKFKWKKKIIMVKDGKTIKVFKHIKKIEEEKTIIKYGQKGLSRS